MFTSAYCPQMQTTATSLQYLKTLFLTIIDTISSHNVNSVTCVSVMLDKGLFNHIKVTYLPSHKRNLCQTESVMLNKGLFNHIKVTYLPSHKRDLCQIESVMSHRLSPTCPACGTTSMDNFFLLLCWLLCLDDLSWLYFNTFLWRHHRHLVACWNFLRVCFWLELVEKYR